MSFPRAARAALVVQSGVQSGGQSGGQSGLPRMVAAMAVVVVVAGFFLSCGSSNHTPSAPSHNAYVTLPAWGSVALLFIDGATGAITVGAQTPQVQNTTPTGLALSPSKKFLYAVNSGNDTISIFNVAANGTLTQTATPTPAGLGPHTAVVDPSGQYLLVTNSSGGNVSVYTMDASSGALSEVSGSPFAANEDPSEIVFTYSGNFVYVSNPSLGRVTGFAFANGSLTQISGSPFVSGAGAFGLAVDGSDRFLYVTNPSASNSYPYANTIGNVSGFNIDPSSGALSAIAGSPFASTHGAGPTAITVDPLSRYVYAMTTGSTYSIWCFSIYSLNGQLTEVTSSPFSVAAGGLFAIIDPAGNFFYTGSQSGKGIDGFTYNVTTGAPTAISGSPFSTGTAPGKMVFSE